MNTSHTHDAHTRNQQQARRTTVKEGHLMIDLDDGFPHRAGRVSMELLQSRRVDTLGTAASLT